VHDLVGAAFDKARALLAQRRELLTRCAQQLLEEETLSREALIELVGQDQVEPLPQIRAK